MGGWGGCWSAPGGVQPSSLARQAQPSTAQLLQGAWENLEKTTSRFMRRAKVARIVFLVLTDYAYSQNKCRKRERLCQRRLELLQLRPPTDGRSLAEHEKEEGAGCKLLLHMLITVGRTA